MLQISTPLAHATRARDPMQSYLPLISSPLASINSRRSMRSSSPIVPHTDTKPSQLSLPSATVASALSPILLDLSPLTPAVSLKRPPKIQPISPLTPAAIAQRPAVFPGPTTSPTACVQSPSEELSLTLATGSVPKDPVVPVSSVTSPAAVASDPSILLSPPLAPAITRRASILLSPPSIKLNPPILPNASTQAPSVVPPFVAGPPPQESGSLVDLGEVRLFDLCGA